MIHKNQFDPNCISFTDENIIYNTRLFWRQMAYWSRVYFNSVFLDIGSAQEVYSRLYDTPSRFTFMLQYFLGRSFSDAYLQLLNEYNVLLRQLVGSVVNGDAEAIDENVSLLYENARVRAEFLARVLPSLDEDVLREMLNTHLLYEMEEINTYVNQDYSSIIEIYDNLARHADTVADYFSKGIIDLITLHGSRPIEPEDAYEYQDMDGCITYDQMNTILGIATFWIDLVQWFRAYRISIMAGIGESEELFERLIQVTVDFGNQLKVFFDEEMVDEFILLIQQYLALIGQLLEARLSNNTEEADRIFGLLIENMNQRAALISLIIPAISETEWRNHLYNINTTLIQMGTAFMIGDYTSNIQIFDGLQNQAENLGFYFVDSIFGLID